jgi:DNA processing protein
VIGVEAAPVAGVDACDECLRRTAVIAALAGRLDVEWRRRDATARVLALPGDDLLALADAPARERIGAHRPERARERVAAAGLAAACRCADSYPARLRDLPDPPAVLFAAGRLAVLADPDAVAIVGARRATTYGLEVARSLGRGVSSAGVPVVSGLALGVDSAAHAGALEAAAPPVAVLACGADIAYPPSKRRLYEEIVGAGCVVSELPPGFRPLRWCFVARNRIIAALSRVTVIVEAAERSGSLTTADLASELGRTVAAVPGRITSRQAAGTNGLLQSGAPPVCGTGDVLDLLADATGGPRRTIEPPPAEPLEPALRRILAVVEDGRGTLGALADTPEQARAVLAALGELELRGLVRRGFGGRYERVA